MPRKVDPDTRKIIAFDPETWHALRQLGRDRDRTIQELADEAFDDLLKKHHRPVTLKQSLKQSVHSLGKRDPVETTSENSFPASDPPGWAPPGRARSATKRPRRNRR